MTILKFTGIVEVDAEIEFYDTGRAIYQPTIGGVDVIGTIEATEFARAVTVAIAGEQFDGELHAWGGSPDWSEYTPGDAAELKVGPHNLFTVLRRHEGQTVTLWIADEPINVLEEG